MLATVSGISQISQYDAERWGDYWRFTPQSVKRMIGDVFGGDNIQVDYFGNCYAATNSLRGISIEELDKEKLNFKDADYPVIITIVATKKRAL